MFLTHLAIAFGAILSPPEPYTPPQAIPNILTYEDGSVEVDASFNAYENLTENTPIAGSIFVTQEKPLPIDINAFSMDGKPLSVVLVSATTISDTSPINVSIYSFTLPAMSAGLHTLSPITVKIGNKTYKSLPLTVEISPANTPAQ